MDVNAGKLNKRVEIVRISTSPDADGYAAPTETVIRRPWAQFSRVSGSEALRQGADMGDVKVRFLIRSGHTALAGIAGAGADMGDGHAVGRRAARQRVNERLRLGLGGKLLPLTPCVRVVLHHPQAHRVHFGVEVALAGVRLLLLRAQHSRDLVEERGPVDQGLVLLQDRLDKGVGAVGSAVLALGSLPARLVAVAVELGVDLQIAQRGLHVHLTGDELLEIQQHGVIACDVAGGRGQAQIALDGCAHIHLLAVDRMGAHRLAGKGEEVTGHHTKRCFNCFVAHGFLLTDFWISATCHKPQTLPAWWLPHWPRWRHARQAGHFGPFCRTR